MSNTDTADKLELKLKDDEWWIINHDPEVGPYDLKRDAQSDLVGLQQFYRHEVDKTVE